MNVENQSAVEENEVISVDVEETEEQTATSEKPVVPEQEETRTNVQEQKPDELEDYSENVKKNFVLSSNFTSSRFSTNFNSVEHPVNLFAS